MLVQCKFCENKVEKADAVRIDEKNFHPFCAKEYSDRKELYETITKFLKLRAPGPANLKLVKNYRIQGYTYKGMTNALIYHYEIKKGSREKAGERIGIIPYVYEEANEYFDKKKKEEEKRLEIVRKNMELDIPETRTVRVQKRERKPLITPIPLVNLFED